jgi:PAS domain S-box-containing protein
VPIVVMGFDAEILDVNQKAVDLTGRSEADLIGSYWCDLIGEAQTSFEEDFGDLPENGLVSSEMKIPSPSGERTLRVRMTAIDYGGRRAIQWIGYDITELAELERMRDDLMHMIVHDLQNPLSNIVGSLQMMEQALREQDGAPPMMDVLRVAMRSSSRLKRLISSLLDLRQLEEGKADLDRILVSPGLLAREAIEFVQPIMNKKQQRLSVDIPPDLPQISVDRDMLTRVLTNLLDNAAKFTSTYGEIGLAIWQEEEGVVFQVSDNGPGISPDEQDRIFERFTRLERTRRTKGTGLGLPFCRLAVEAHGGTIWVNSTPGEGSQFTFRLPLEAE